MEGRLCIIDHLPYFFDNFFIFDHMFWYYKLCYKREHQRYRSEKEQEALADYGVFPVYVVSQNKLLEDDPHMLKMKEILDFSQSPPKLKNWHKIDEILISHVRLALMGKKTAEQALADVARDIEVIKSESISE